MDINRLHRSVLPYISNQTYDHINDHFVSIIPGDGLSECIEAVVKYCKDNNTSATLSFNGVANKVESWVNPRDLSNFWFLGPSETWYQSQKIELRDKKLTDLGI